MVAVRVGDTYSFDIVNSDIPSTDPVWVLLGDVPEEDYHVILTGRVKWQDPAGDPAERVVSIALDLDAFDAAGNPIDWDSRIHGHVDETYQTRSGDQKDRPIVVQSTVHVPAGATLKLMLYDNQPPSTPALRFEDGRVVLVVVTAQV